MGAMEEPEIPALSSMPPQGIPEPPAAEIPRGESEDMWSAPTMDSTSLPPRLLGVLLVYCAGVAAAVALVVSLLARG